MGGDTIIVIIGRRNKSTGRAHPRGTVGCGRTSAVPVDETGGGGGM